MLGPMAGRGTILARAGSAAGPVLGLEECWDSVLEVRAALTEGSGRRVPLRAGSAGGQGVCTTFVHIAAQAKQVAMRAVALQG